MGHSCTRGLCVFMWLIKVAFLFSTFKQMLHTNFLWKCTLFLCSESPPVEVKEASQYSHSKILDCVRSFSQVLVLEETPAASRRIAGFALFASTLHAPGSKRRYPCTQTASAVQKYFLCRLQFFYWLSHLTCISSLKAKNEQKTLIYTQLKIARYNQHFFASFRRILRN